MNLRIAETFCFADPKLARNERDWPPFATTVYQLVTTGVAKVDSRMFTLYVYYHRSP